MTKEAEKEAEKTLRIPSRWRANYSHWNLMLKITMRQATYLTIGVKPGTNIIHNRIINDRFKEIFELAESWADSEALRYTNYYHTEIFSAVWLNWLKSMSIPVPEEWQPIDNNGKTFIADANIDIAEQVTDRTIIKVIANDIYNRMKSDAYDDISRVGGQKIYDFMITNEYQLSEMSYWLIDEKEDPRAPNEIGKRVQLYLVNFHYKNEDTDDCGSVPFRKVWEAFDEIKSR